MKVIIYLNEENHNKIILDGTLTEFLQGSESSTLVMSGGENSKKLRGLFTEIREKGKVSKMEGVIEGATCTKMENGTEILCFPSPVRVHIL